MKYLLEWNYLGLIHNKFCNSCNCSSKQAPSQQQTLSYQNPESPSPGTVFSTETFKGADTNSEVEGDNDFDE